MPDLYGFDLGNSRLKLARRTDSGIEPMGAWDHAQWPERFPIPPAASLALCSVAPALAERLAQQLAAQGCTLSTLARSDGGVFASGLLLSGVESPTATGADRLLAAAGALLHCDNHPAIVIDAGSAVTVDLVTPDGTFFGGAIIPGLRLMAQALTRDTAVLPAVTFDSDAQPRMPGTSTIPAIRDGILLGLAGAIDRLVDELNSRLAGPAQLYITGGDGPLLQRLLLNPAIPRPEPVFEGLFQLVDLVAAAAADGRADGANAGDAADG